MRFSPGCGCCGCNGTIHVTVKDCPFPQPNLSGALVTVKDADGDTVGTDTSDAFGLADVDITEAGDYSVTVSKSGYYPITEVISATCTTNNVTIVLGRTAPVLVRGCNVQAYRGLSFTMTHGTSGRIYTGTTVTSFGVPARNLNFAIAEPGTFSYATTAHRHNVKTGSITSFDAFCEGGVATIDLVQSTGFRCTTWNCAHPSGLDSQDCIYPIAETLHLTDSAFGSTTLTWGTVSGVSGWRGSLSATAPGPISTTANYLLRQDNIGTGTFRVSYDLGAGAGVQNITGVPCGGSGGTDEWCPSIDVVEFHPDISNAAGANQTIREGLYGPTVPTFTVTE